MAGRNKAVKIFCCLCHLFSQLVFMVKHALSQFALDCTRGRSARETVITGLIFIK